MTKRKIDEQQEATMVLQHAALVVSIALKFKPIPPNDIEDIISVGSIGLIKAIRAFDPEKGIAFSTFAGKIIHNEIFRELRRVNSKKSHEYLDIDVESMSTVDISDYLPQTLTEQEKDILHKRFFLDYTYEAIGKEKGHTKQWANNRVNAILDKIREANDKKAKNSLG